jgi:hypothetical protein
MKTICNIYLATGGQVAGKVVVHEILFLLKMIALTLALGARRWAVLGVFKDSITSEEFGIGGTHLYYRIRLLALLILALAFLFRA